MKKLGVKACITFILMALMIPALSLVNVNATSYSERLVGGGYAVTGQIPGVGYTAEVYDATSGLPTSEANCVLAANDGYIWIGGYSGIIRYDGSVFERLPSTDGLTSGRGLYEDSQGRIWVATNDNGVVVIDGNDSRHFTKNEGLTSSSIRCFAEDSYGNIFIGSTAGLMYVDDIMQIHVIDDERINGERIINMVTDYHGRVYGYTKNGAIFEVNTDGIAQFYNSSELGTGKITCMVADPRYAGCMYFGTESNCIYYGNFGTTAAEMARIDTGSCENINCMHYGCGRVWLASNNVAGYLDLNNTFHVIENVPFDEAIEMITTDYQGNLWFASSRYGVMKVVANNFLNYTETAGIEDEVVNTTCFLNGDLYVGTDNGLRVIASGHAMNYSLTEYFDDVRIRHIMSDSNDDLWFSTFTHQMGLVCRQHNGSILQFTTDNGMPSNEIRCTYEAADGSIIAGTNAGIAIIRDEQVVDVIDAEDGVDNTVILTVCEGDNGQILAGSDGNGMYLIENGNVTHFGTADGLTSDVVMRITRDETRDLYWIVTSNSIEYMRDGVIINVSTFPYNNNFEIIPDHDNNLWVMSSQGVYVVNADDAINDDITDYRLFDVANGLTSVPVAHCHCSTDGEGNLYIAGQTGVSRVNIDSFFEASARVQTGVRSVYFNDEQILPDENGDYVIPAGGGRIQIMPSVMDYTLTNPLVRVYLEGAGDEDDGNTTMQSKLSSLEFTDLRYGDYVLHIQILDKSTNEVVLDNAFNIIKQPKFFELLSVRIVLIALLAAVAGVIVWRVMTGTVIRKQYLELQEARDEAQRANSAKSRFLANMSHELRTPINTIVGMDEMIMRENPTEDVKEYSGKVKKYAQDIKLASESLLVLINDLLDVSRIESGQMTLNEQEYDPEEMIREVLAMVRSKVEEKRLEFVTDIDEKLPVRLYGDGLKIKQIVLNLITNAVQYTNEGSVYFSVRVTAKAETSVSLRISVKDTGAGIREEDIEKLFNSYKRLDEMSNSSSLGAGLGLDISRQYAELMDGKLKCESVYGQGSEFILTVKQKISDPKEIGEFTELEETYAEGEYIPQFIAPDADILVVEDNAKELQIIKGLLKPTRVFVTNAKTAEECIEKIKFNDFYLVFVDATMPGIDDKEILDEIREIKPDMPVFALTSNLSLAGEEHYKSMGYNGLLPKPLSPADLENTIKSVLPENIMLKPRG